MDLKSEILREHSKPQAVRLAAYIGNDQKKFDELMKLFLGNDYRITQRAAWVVSHCHDQYPELIIPHLEDIISNLGMEITIAVKRNSVRILQDVEVPDDLWGPLADHCFRFMKDSSEPIAVKVFAMTILGNCARRFPELKEEVKMAIEDQLPFASAGYLSRSKKVFKILNEL